MSGTINKETGVSVAILVTVACLCTGVAAWASSQFSGLRSEARDTYVTKEVFDRELRHISSALTRIEEKIGGRDG